MKSLLILIFLFSMHFSYSQKTHFQNIRGVVTDKESQMPVSGVNIIISGSIPLTGTVSDENGNFRLENIQTGRISLQFSCLGYNTKLLGNLELNSAKELILKVELDENLIRTSEVEVKSWSEKDQSINKMATVSARSFTVEETQRFAGSFGDPARMASSYAGVMSTGTERNDIIIRGNSPTGLLWILDDIEIQNPNHYGAFGTTGGPISILNNNLLTNSDFFTGAFPAEYGNALSGVFDLNLRNGNNEKREYWGQFGWNGFEAGTEGPISRNKQSSYLIAYRYSMLALLDKMKIGIGYDPLYTDLTFKLNFPKTKIGKISIIGIGGNCLMELWDSENNSEDWTFSNYGEDITFGTKMGTIGVNHTVFINNTSRISTSVSLSGNQVVSKTDTFSVDFPEKFQQYGENSSESKTSFSSKYFNKINAKNTIETGVIFQTFFINYSDSSFYKNKYVKRSNVTGEVSLLRNYFQWQYRLNNDLTINCGINHQLITDTKKSSLEPRMGIKLNLPENQSVAFGAGIHAAMQPRIVYFYQTTVDSINYLTTNKELNFTKSCHFIVGYDYLLSENLRFKAEAYYQYLYNIPVCNSGSPEFSLINSGADFSVNIEDSLTNKGKGYNYGLEITLEKFLSKKFYYLLTVSLFESTYKNPDNIIRNTAFNGNYVINLLGGYEVLITKNNYLTLNSRNVLAGGKRYIPIDIEKSIETGRTVYDYQNAWENKYKDYLRFDIRIGFKMNRTHYTQEFAFDLQNITNNKNVFIEQFDPITHEIKSKLQFGFMPMFTYRIQF
ncbi:MAG: TonB-dependent receptor [Bacteroidota bacterium]